MGALRLALRFRDFAPNIDSIDEHNKILRKKKAVLWGWWKKEHEPAKQDIIKTLANEDRFSVVLLNRNTQRQFETTATRIIEKGRINRNLIPIYYRDNFKSVALWIRIESVIAEVDYNEILATKFGSETLALDDNSTIADTIPEVVQQLEGNINPSIALLSDFHFGEGDHNFLMPPAAPMAGGPQVSLVDALGRDAKRLMEKPGLMIAAGDFTSKAKWEPTYRDAVAEQVKSIAQRFGLGPEKIVLCPGNHDVSRLGADRVTAVKLATRFEHEDQFRIFRAELLGRPHKEPLSACLTFPSKGFNFVIGVLNSANLAPTQFPEYGYVGTDPLNEILHIMEQSVRPNIKILVLHHHLIPIRSVELPSKGGISLTIDAHEILRRSQEAGVQLILHGHQHVPRVMKTSQLLFSKGAYCGLEDNMYIVSAGSVGSKAIPSGGMNTYTIISFGRDEATIQFRTLSNDGSETAPLMLCKLLIKPS